MNLHGDWICQRKHTLLESYLSREWCGDGKKKVRPYLSLTEKTKNTTHQGKLQTDSSLRGLKIIYRALVTSTMPTQTSERKVAYISVNPGLSQLMPVSPMSHPDSTPFTLERAHV
jgi:hypothetical protein